MGFRAEAQWAPTTSSTSASITREGKVFVGWSSVPSLSYLTSNHSLIVSSSQSFLFAGSNGYTSINGLVNSSIDGSLSHYMYTSSNGLIGGYKFVYDNGITTYKRSFQFDGGASEITLTQSASNPAQVSGYGVERAQPEMEVP